MYIEVFPPRYNKYSDLSMLFLQMAFSKKEKKWTALGVKIAFDISSSNSEV